MKIYFLDVDETEYRAIVKAMPNIKFEFKIFDKKRNYFGAIYRLANGINLPEWFHDKYTPVCVCESLTYYLR